MRGDIVVVFARAPRLGTVKRRLAAGIGDMAALRFHRETLARTARRLAADRRFAVIVAVTPRGARGPWLRGLAREAQGFGDLGRRMTEAFRRHPRRRMVLVGCDIPDLAAADVAAAFAGLGRARAVFGPARDGGYWLVGMGATRPAHPFRGVRWSSEHALADTLVHFRDVPTIRLRVLRDIDDAGDLAAWRAGSA